jgi:hypothetical protein
MFTDHIAKLPNLVVLCVLAIWLNGKRPTRPCVEINPVAAALTDQYKAQRAEQCLKIPEGNRSAALKDLIEVFLTAGHANSGDFGDIFVWDSATNYSVEIFKRLWRSVRHDLMTKLPGTTEQDWSKSTAAT